MSDQNCDCTDLTVEQATERSTTTDRWIEGRPVTTAQLPVDVAGNMSRFFGTSIETFDDVIAAIRGIVEGDGIAVDELCHVTEETPHSAKTEDETYFFRCFYDGIALAHLVEEPVEIRTESPTNESIELQATPDGAVDVTQSDAVMSFGVATNREIPTGDSPTTQEVYEAICPYVNAFRTREDYERWAPDVAATTVGIPLDAGVPIAGALTAKTPAEGT